MSAVGGIYITCRGPEGSAQIELHDLPGARAVAQCKFRHPLSFDGDNFKFRVCQFTSALFPRGSVSMDQCAAKTVRAAKHVLVVDTSVEHVVAGGDVYVAGCRDLKSIRAGGTIFCTYQQALNECTVETTSVVIIPPTILPESGFDLLLESVTFYQDVMAHPMSKMVTLDRATCMRDVIFPLNSSVPERERVVLLRNGSVLYGQVVRGRLIDMNPKEAAPASAS